MGYFPGGDPKRPLGKPRVRFSVLRIRIQPSVHRIVRENLIIYPKLSHFQGCRRYKEVDIETLNLGLSLIRQIGLVYRKLWRISDIGLDAFKRRRILADNLVATAVSVALFTIVIVIEEITASAERRHNQFIVFQMRPVVVPTPGFVCIRLL